MVGLKFALVLVLCKAVSWLCACAPFWFPGGPTGRHGHVLPPWPRPGTSAAARHSPQPKLTPRHAFPYAGPNSLDIITTEGMPRPEPSRLILYVRFQYVLIDPNTRCCASGRE
eukprot:scaffold11617_cov130-Isochrysis_galbana.AAC.4